MTLADTHAEISGHCAEIAKLYKPGAKITVIVRNPSHDQSEPHAASMLVSDDDIDSVIAALQYLKQRDSQ